jgi:hypothetical protein
VENNYFLQSLKKRGIIFMKNTNTKTKGQREDNRQDEIIRIQKKKNNFVMLDKGFIDDKRLSYKAKGILTYLLSKPDGWKVIVKDLCNHARDGERAVYSGLKELKNFGYYQKYPVREGQRIVRWESVVYECPEDCPKETKKSNNNPKEPNHKEEPQDSLFRRFEDIQSEHIQNEDIQNVERNNIKSTQNLKQHRNESINHDTPNNENSKNDFDTDTIDTNTVNIDVNSYDTASPIINNTKEIPVIRTYSKQEVADKISLDKLKDKHPDNLQELDLLFECLCDVLTVDNPVSPTFRISQQNIPFLTVKNVFIDITDKHVSYVIRSLNNNDNKFKINKNVKSYCMTSLYHAPRTIGYYSDKIFTQPQPQKSKWDILLEQKAKRDLELELEKNAKNNIDLEQNPQPDFEHFMEHPEPEPSFDDFVYDSNF